MSDEAEAADADRMRGQLDGLSLAAAPLVEAGVRARVERIVELLQSVVSSRSKLPPFGGGEGKDLADDLTAGLMRNYAEHAKNVFDAVLNLIVEATVASEASADGSLRVARPVTFSAVRLRPKHESLAETPAERHLQEALQGLRGAKRGGKRTGSSWRTEGYMKFAQEVIRTRPLFAEALARLRKDDDVDDVIAQIAAKAEHRRAAFADVKDKPKSEPFNLALRHAARMTGLNAKGRAVLYKHYLIGVESLTLDEPYGVLDLVDPDEVEVSVEETLWPG